MHLRTCSALSCLLGGALLAQAPAGPTTPVHTNHGALIRCGTPAVAPTGAGIDNPDCDYNQTNPSGTYAPTTLLRIPVVVHVIQTTSGTGFLSDTLVQSQITVLNEDFRALAGTPGAGGTDSQIEPMSRCRREVSSGSGGSWGVRGSPSS